MKIILYSSVPGVPNAQYKHFKEAFQNRFTSTMKNKQPSTSSGGLPPCQACSLGSAVTGTVSYLEEEGGFFWLQRDPARVEEIGAKLEREAEQQLVEGFLAVGEVERSKSGVKRTTRFLPPPITFTNSPVKASARGREARLSGYSYVEEER